VKQSFLFRVILPAALLVSAAIFTSAQDPGNKQNSRPHEQTAVGPKTEPSNPNTKESVKYSYEFSQPAFFVKHIVIEHDETGRGTIKFERLNEDTPVTEPLELSPAASARVFALWDQLKFLDSDTNYQSNKHFAHLGVMKIGMERGDRKRTAQFDWTQNNAAAELVAEYRRAADQAIFVFDISLARENQPLNAPKLMEALESMMKRNAISDPQQLLPLLKDLTTDERIPLIARNHAQRLIKKIQK
jgi:hypothetical protein